MRMFGLKNEKMKHWLRILAMVMAMVMLLSVLAGCTTAGTTDGNDGDKGDGGKKEEQIVDTSKMSGPEHWQYVGGKALGEAMSAITGTYGNLMGTVNGKGAQGAKVDVTVELGDAVLSMIEESISQSGMNMDLSFLNTIKLGLDVKSSGEKGQVDAMLGLGSNEIATISAILDMAAGEAFVGLPGLNDTYLGFDLSHMGIGMTELDQVTAMVEQVLAVMPSEEVLQKLVDKYLAIALKEFKDVEKESAKLELNGLSQDCTKLTVSIHHEDVLNVAKNVLTELKTDADVKKILEDVAELPDMGGEDLYPSFQDGITDALESIEEQLEDPEKEVVILTVYTDSKNDVIGLCLAPESGDEDMHYTVVTEGDKFEFELAFLDEMTVEGNGTNKGGKVSGDFVVMTQGQAVLDLALMDFDLGKLEKGQISGTVVIAAPEMDGMAAAVSGMKLSIGIDTGKESATVQLKAENTMGVLGSIKLEYKATSGGNITVPGNAVDPTDQTALMQWLMGMNFEKLIGNLEKAGLPAELTAMLEQLAGQFAGMN